MIQNFSEWGMGPDNIIPVGWSQFTTEEKFCIIEHRVDMMT